MTELVYSLYPVFLDAGYLPALFWELSIGEINDLLESYARRKDREGKHREAELKDEIMVLFNQALQIGDVVGRLMSKEAEIRMPKYYYPELFAGTEYTNFTAQEEEGDEPKLSPEMELHKARMDDFIFRHNMAMKMARERGESSGRNDIGEAASNHRGTD